MLRIPLEAIRYVALRRGWWETLLSHFLIISYDDGDRSHTEKVRISRQRGEEAAVCVAEAANGNPRLRFEVDPILTVRLISGLVLSGLFVFSIGSLRFYFQGNGPFIEVLQTRGMLTAVIMLVVAMIAFWQ